MNHHRAYRYDRPDGVPVVSPSWRDEQRRRVGFFVGGMGPTMLVRLLGMVVQRFGHRFIVAVLVLVALIAMPVAVRMHVTGLSVMDPMAKMQRASAPERQHDKQDGSGPAPTHDR